jgi:predicted lactoylglutathione lyase
MSPGPAVTMPSRIETERRPHRTGRWVFCSDEIYVDAADENESLIHLAFQAEDRSAVHRFHAAGIANGGRDNGPPGERSYHPGFYACVLLDPSGNNIEAVTMAPDRALQPT